MMRRHVSDWRSRGSRIHVRPRPASYQHKESLWDRCTRQAAKEFTFTRLAILLIALPLVVYVVRHELSTAIVIEPFSVPKQLLEAGYTPQVMANRIGDKIKEIEKTTETNMKKDRLISIQEESPLDIEVPGTKLSLKELIDISRSVFGDRTTRISGAITFPVARKSAVDSSCNKGQAAVTVNVVSRDIWFPTRCMEVDTSATDALVQSAAELTLAQVNPYVYGAYLVEYSRPAEAEGVARGIVDGVAASHDSRKKKDLFNKAAYNLLGNALLAQGKNNDAVDAYRQAIKIDPLFPLPHNNLGVAYRAMKHEPESDAIAQFNEAIAYDKNNEFPYPYNNLGNIYDENRQFDCAIEQFKKAIAIDKNDWAAWNGWGDALFKQVKDAGGTGKDRLDEAIAKFLKAIEVNPNYAAAHANLGEAYFAQKKYAEAAREYKTATKLDPKLADAYTGWAHVLDAQGKARQARQLRKLADRAREPR